MTMFIHFFCLSPLGLNIKLNFNMWKVAFSLLVHQLRWLFGSLRGTNETCIFLSFDLYILKLPLCKSNFKFTPNTLFLVAILEF